MSVFENSNKFQSAFHLFPHRRCYTHATVLSRSCHFVVKNAIKREKVELAQNLPNVSILSKKPRRLGELYIFLRKQTNGASRMQNIKLA